MKIVTFSPVIEKSAIGMVNNLIVLMLQKLGHHVVVIRTESLDYIDFPSRVNSCEVIRWNDLYEQRMVLETADLIIYHIGDNYALHGGCIKWLSEHPGIVCLHDYYLGHLFNGAVSFDNGNLKLVDLLYSESMRDKFLNTSSISSEDFINTTKSCAPMTEWITKMALGVVVHSAWDIQRVIDSCPGFVCVQPLPHIKSYSKKIENSFSKKKYDADQTIYVLTMGSINANKRMESIIHAIAKSKNTHRICYHLAGYISVDMAQNLNNLAKRLNVTLIIWEEVSDDKLAELIEQSDIITCLRWPILESASASLIEALFNKKPVIVTNAGFYAELPDQYVFKVNPHNEVNELYIQLDKLIYKMQHDTTSLALHVENAYQWATETFSIEKYVNALLECGSTIKNQQTLIKVRNYFAEIIGHWNIEGLSSIYLPNLEIFW